MTSVTILLDKLSNTLIKFPKLIFKDKVIKIHSFFNYLNKYNNNTARIYWLTSEKVRVWGINKEEAEVVTMWVCVCKIIFLIFQKRPT